MTEPKSKSLDWDSCLGRIIDTLVFSALLYGSYFIAEALAPGYEMLVALFIGIFGTALKLYRPVFSLTGRIKQAIGLKPVSWVFPFSEQGPSNSRDDARQ